MEQLRQSVENFNRRWGVSLGRDGFKTSRQHTENDGLRLSWDSNVQGCERGEFNFCLTTLSS